MAKIMTMARDAMCMMRMVRVTTTITTITTATIISLRRLPVKSSIHRAIRIASPHQQNPTFSKPT